MDCMGFKILGNLHIIVVGERDPAPTDWKAYMDAIPAEEKRGIDIKQMRTLVFSDGGGPNAAQRKVASDLLGARDTPLAIVTGSAVTRVMTTARRWFNPHCRAFPPSEVGAALEFLGIPGIKFQQILRLAREVQLGLGISAVKSLESARFRGGAASSLRSSR
jgi:hypothetical protein